MRRLWPLSAVTGLVLLAISGAACKQGVGDRCEQNSDCSSGICSMMGMTTANAGHCCSSIETCGGTASGSGGTGTTGTGGEGGAGGTGGTGGTGGSGGDDGGGDAMMSDAGDADTSADAVTGDAAGDASSSDVAPDSAAD